MKKTVYFLAWRKDKETKVTLSEMPLHEYGDAHSLIKKAEFDLDDAEIEKAGQDVVANIRASL